MSVRSSSLGDSGTAQAENCYLRAAPVLIIIKQVWGHWSAANISQASKKEQCAWRRQVKETNAPKTECVSHSVVSDSL